jgi:hypothetical protein
MFYEKGNNDGQYYNGARDMESFENYLLAFMQNKDESSLRHEMAASSTYKAVYDLEDTNFVEFISTGAHFVKFFAPWYFIYFRL